MTYSLEVQIGVAKVGKYASRESGDTLEVIERPHGGVSAVLVDGQRSGRNARIISNIVARKAVSLLGEGVRDGAVARAAHDYLRTHRQGQVSAELQILSVDLVSRSLVVSRNSRCPALVATMEGERLLDADSEPIGIRRQTKPVIVELPLIVGTVVAIYTDGMLERGSKHVPPESLLPLITRVPPARRYAQTLADALLDDTLSSQQGRASDDASVLVGSVLDRRVPSGVRRLSLSLPV
jgi:serine phosphatase RsbU (regulator of sigma subunit)